MEKIIKNTIEDFTDDKEIIEIEKLMFDKKYEEALKKLKICANEKLDKLSPQQRKEENYKFYIMNILGIICKQYTDLPDAIFNLCIINQVDDWESLGELLLFYNILQKMENEYYEKRQTEMANEYIAQGKMTLKYLMNKIDNQIPAALEISNLIYNPSKKEQIIGYVLRKFQEQLPTWSESNLLL